MKIKQASILDYSYPGISPDIWLSDGTLNPVHKDFVLKLLNSFYVNYNLKSPEQWIIDITVIGSLTTNRYIRTSDFDCHVIVDIDKFIVTNMSKASKEEAMEYLDVARKEWDRAKIYMPFGEHFLELYFESSLNPSNTENVGRYSILQSKWLKDPIYFAQDLDYEESRKQALEGAKELANELDDSFGEISRQIQRIDELKEVIQAWPEEKRQLYYEKVQKKLDLIEEEIEKSIQIKQDLVDQRHLKQDAFSENEIQFKFLARFHYFSILSNLKTLMEQTGGKVTTQELPLIDKIISEGSNKVARLRDKYLIDPNGKVIPMGGMDHGLWIMRNRDLLEKQYGIRDRNTDWFKVMQNMIEKGWVRITLSGEAKGGQFGVDVQDFRNIPSSVDNFIAEHFNPNEGPIYFANAADEWVPVSDPFPSAQKAVNKAIQRKRMGSIKEAFLKQAFEEPNEADTDICVDFDKTIAQDAKYPAIGEPIEGAKESLEKLKDLGYNVVIYSCRGDSEEGLELMTKWLDDHDMPYDSIFNGEKPFFKYVIDDKAIHFDTWDKALKQVEKSDKVASIHITSAAHYWVDPSGKIYSIEGSHDTWIEQNKDILKQYGINFTGLDSTKNKMIYDGWGRVGDLFGNGGRYQGQGIEIADLSNVPSSVFNFISNFGNDKYFMLEDLQKRFVELSVGDLMEDGQAVINSYLRRGRLAHAAIALQTIDPKTFKRKEPYALFIGTGDYGKAGKIDMFNVYGEHPMITESNALPTVTLDTLVQQNIPIIGKEPRAGEKQPYQDISGLYKQAQTKKIKQGSYSCLMALLPHEIAQEIVEFGVRTVPDDKLYLDEDGKLGRELESHITIKYGLLTNDAKHVRRSFNHDKPFKATLGKVRHFQPPELPFDVLTVEIISDDLVKANKKVCDNFDCAKGLVSDEYKPHITIAYMKRDTAEEYIGSDEFEGKEIELDTVIFSPHKGNRTYFSISQDKESSFVLEQINKIASGNNFLPSFFNDTNNEWQFEHGGDDQEIDLNPDSVSDETTWYAPCTEGKPRTKEVWRQFLSMFKNPFSKKEEMTISSAQEDLVNIGNITFKGKKNHTVKIEVPQDLLDQYFAIAIDMKKVLKDPKLSNSSYWDKIDRTRANLHDQLVEFAFNNLFEDKNWKDFPAIAGDIRYKISDFIESMIPRDDLHKEATYDPELEQKEKDALGEDETLLEYSKGFYDPKDHDFPHNTTWDSLTQDGEPSKPTSVTYSPQISNEDNLDQNSPGGYPRRFMGKPKGEWFSNEGEVNNALIDMLKNKEAALEITADLSNAYWIDPDGNQFQVRGSNFGNSYGRHDTHDGWIQDNLEMLKKDYGIEPRKDQWGSHLDSRDLINYGWIRIGDSHGKGWGVSVKDLSNIPSSVDNLLAQFATEGAKIEIDDSHNNYETIEWPVKSIQQAVNKARTIHATIDGMTKIAGNADGGWISPTGQYIPTSDHFGYVATHLADFGLLQLEESTQTKFELDSAVVRAMQYIFDQGWLRVRVWGDAILIQGNNLSNVKNHAEDFIYDNLEGSKRIRIETDDNQAYTCTTDEFKAEGWDAFLRQPLMAKQAVLDFDNQYPLASGSVDGRTVIDGVPNQSSIGASLTDYDILPGIREVSFSSFTQMPNLSYYSVDEENRTKALAEQIQQSNEITPLIVAIDNQGPYILEGGHRFDALRELGANSFPAMVVLDNESLDRMAKKASIEEIDGLPVLVNPTENELKGFSRNLKGGHMFRGLIDPHTGDLFVWDAYEAIHTYVIQKLGLDVKYSDQSPFCLYFPPSDIYDALARQQEVKRGDKLRSTGSLDKKAGSYSSTYTDEQGEQFFNEQHQNDVDQVPYTNFDQRSAPNAFHDSPENTAFNIGWAKDNQPYVVRLDILEDPAYRLDPFGIGEYNVTYFSGMPNDDGLEQMNPE